MDNVDKLCERLCAGQIFKNYKELCELLEEPFKKGNSQKAQFKKWKRFFDFQKLENSNEIEILEVFSQVKEIVDKRKDKIDYLDNIQKLIITMLAKSRYNGHMFIAKNKLFKELKMINSNYTYCKDNVAKFSKFINVASITIDEFYTSSKRMFERNMEEVLNKLENKFLLKWIATPTVCVVNIQADRNNNILNNIKAVQLHKGIDEFGEDIYEYVANYNTNTSHRRANPNELQRINELENSIAKDLDCKDIHELILKGKWNIFRNRIHETLFEEFNILFYYDSYEIIYNDHIVIEEWMQQEGFNIDDIDVIQEELELTEGIIKRLYENVESRHNKAMDKYKNGEHKAPDITHKVKERIYRRKKRQYLTDNTKLIVNLIDSEAENIKEKVKRVKLT